MVILIQQCRYLLEKMLKWQEADFIKNGGVRERMHAARTEARAEQWDQAIYSMLDLAADAVNLDARLAQVVAQARRAAASIARRKG